MADTEALVNELNGCAERGDFETAFGLVRKNLGEVARKLEPTGVRDALKKTTKDRLLLSFLDGIDFAKRPLDESVMRLEKLLSFKEGALVINPAWGLGKVKRLDYFYRRITVDFKTRKGHQFVYLAATDMLELAPENHILVRNAADPAVVGTMIREQPGAFVKEVLKSYGDLPLVRIEEICVNNGFVKAVNWKKFWESARGELRKDKLVAIPVKRTEPLRLMVAEEDYGDNWLMAFSHETDPKLILAKVREFNAQDKFKAADAETRAKIGERLAFAVTAARNVDDALYAQLACLVSGFGFTMPTATEMRNYLWERRRFVRAAAALPARDVGNLIAFLADSDESKAKLHKNIPDFCFTAVSEIVSQFGKEEACRAAVAEYMKQPKAPATLTTLLVGKYENFKDWAELPPLITLLTHAIALGEGRQNGETLKMQNIIRRLFADTKWLAKVFGWLAPENKALFFERFQASIAWDPSTHHAIVMRMTHIDPSLASHLVTVEKKKEYARLTSFRSYAMKKAEYLKLINEEMPANVKRIEFAKGYGDLSENAEYQYAKDEQRALMQKQTLMQEDLETVKPADFADATTDEVTPGVAVAVTADGTEKTYYVLGEWDNDIERGILSSKTRLAQNLLGKKVGDQFELPGSEGETRFGNVKEIRPLPDEIREWMKLPAGMQI